MTYVVYIPWKNRTPGGRIKAYVTVTSGWVSKEDVSGRLVIEFVVSVGSQARKCLTSKATEFVIFQSSPKERLMRRTAFKNHIRIHIVEECHIITPIIPEFRRDPCMFHKSQGSVNYVEVLPLYASTFPICWWVWGHDKQWMIPKEANHGVSAMNSLAFSIWTIIEFLPLYLWLSQPVV